MSKHVDKADDSKSYNAKLRESNREREKKEATEEAMRIRCKTCFKEIAPRLLCAGHGGGYIASRGGASGGGVTLVSATHGANKINSSASGIDIAAVAVGQEDNGLYKFNPEIIADLLFKGALSVEHNLELGTLTIKLLWDPQFLSREEKQELNNFINAILNELEIFRREKQLPDNCKEVKRDQDENFKFLRIALPQTFYRKFIQQLAIKLLPVQEIQEKKRKHQALEDSMRPNPFSTKPKPSAAVNKKRKLEEEQQQVRKPVVSDEDTFYSIPRPGRQPKLKRK